MISIDYEWETKEEPQLPCRELAEEVAGKVLELEGCPWDAQVNLVVTDDASIRQVNREFRGIDAPTDVLSFPMIPFGTPGDYGILEEDESFFDLDTGELLLGDIMISMPRAQAQAKEYGHSLKREFCFLVAHSMLHLLGYDHMVQEEARIMEGKQAQALEELGITR
ncbi:MAG: rRNA maturation RNase YbeY [Eubacteriales bacterium]|nr:rRNA maturation RNase YbeY [Eubacteriales bacterium]